MSQLNEEQSTFVPTHAPLAQTWTKLDSPLQHRLFAQPTNHSKRAVQLCLSSLDPHVDRNQAITQLEALGYKRRDAVYIRASLPKEDPHYGPVPGRKADKLNWEQMRSLTSPEEYTTDQLRTRMMQGVKG